MENYSEQEIKAAQKILDDLCKKHGIPPFRIDRRQGGNWKQLVQRMCGLNPEPLKEGGRPTKYTEDQVRRIGQLVDIISSFDEYDDKGNKVAAPPQVQQAQYELAERASEFIDGEMTEDAVRGVWNKYKVLQKTDIEKLALEPPDDFRPPKDFENF